MSEKWLLCYAEQYCWQKNMFIQGDVNSNIAWANVDPGLGLAFIFRNQWPSYILLYCPHMNAIAPCWWQVSIGMGDGL